jgi:hypothetical protein
MSDIAVSFAVLAAVVVLFVWNRFPVELVALGAALTLWATGQPLLLPRPSGLKGGGPAARLSPAAVPRPGHRSARQIAARSRSPGAMPNATRGPAGPLSVGWPARQ